MHAERRCAGVCHFQRGGGCRIKLSEPLLKVRVVRAVATSPTVLLRILFEYFQNAHSF